ncbi:MAG: IS21 family transposase, partial [Oscillochloris sp.]|nr:IS21 family transposase [Oscillochloris sp.]
TASAYTQTTPRSAPKLGAFRDRIAALLDERTRQPRKQRYTSRRIYQILAGEGYIGSEARIRGYIGELTRGQHPPKTFVPLVFDPGQDAQADWGEAQVILGGVSVTIRLFVMRLCYAHRTFAMAFPTERQEAFFSGHVHAFAFFGGVSQRISYDNLTTAVQPIFTGRTRQEQQAFTAFRSYYLFESHFCNRNAGHEKGQVEHGVGYVRRNALVPIPSFADYAELNVSLLSWCQGEDTRQVQGQPRPIGAMWAEERPLLRPLPPRDYPCCVTTTATLTPYSQVVFETNRYSVPADQAARRLVIRAFPFHVDILRDDLLLTRHPRCYDREQDVLDPLHYLPLLLERPGAFDHAKPLRRWRETWPPAYRQLLTHLRTQWPDGKGVRDFVRILQLHHEHPATVIEQAITQALAIGCGHADGVRLCLHQVLHPEPAPPPLDLRAQPHLDAIGAQPIDLGVYDALFEGGPDGQ